jgi:hypothetical protein
VFESLGDDLAELFAPPSVERKWHPSESPAVESKLGRIWRSVIDPDFDV